MINGSLLGWLIAAPVASLIATVFLVVKSVKDFTYAGPQIRREISKHYSLYVLYAVGRLALWAFVLATLMAFAGIVVYVAVAVLVGGVPSFWNSVVAGFAGILLITFVQFCHHLLWLPGSIAASSHYRMSRFHPLWKRLTPERLFVVRIGLAGIGGVLIAAALLRFAYAGNWASALSLGGVTAALVALYVWATRREEPPDARPVLPGDRARPNILMIGCDTLRADRVGNPHYPRSLTPFIDSLAENGTLFTNCYVPLARTAPSLASYLTGAWPHRHGIRDNFCADTQCHLDCAAFPRILRQTGYRTAAVGDWAGSDLGKYDFGFECLDVPEDQWNLKYFLRQGPKDLRLFLSLFTHNRFGKSFLPEIYYLAGVPLTSDLGRSTRRLITEFAEQGQPFVINAFMATSHPPFGSEYPYYTAFTDPAYEGESKFVMSKQTDPLEIIRSQREPKEAFDLDQIIDLYDGCVLNFDEEVSKIVEHVRRCGIADNTIVVIYSDHGMEFFEHDTWGQGNSALGDFSARVPLLIADPRHEGGNCVSQIVRTVDLAPTLMELLGHEVPGTVQGVSLVKVIDNPLEDLQLPAYFETGIWLAPHPRMHPEHITYPDLLELLEVADRRVGTLAIKDKYTDVLIEARDRMVRVGEWLLVYMPLKTGALYQLFNIVNDPECHTDLARRHPEVVERLKWRLVEWMAEDGHRSWRDEHLVRTGTCGS